MTVPSSPAVVTLTVPVHPTPEQHQVLQRRTWLQSQTRTGFWQIVRADLGTATEDLTWARPQVIAPAVKTELRELLTADDFPGRHYLDHAVAGEVDRLRQLPSRVDWSHLQPGVDLDDLSLPNRPFVARGDLLLLPDVAIEVDAFALPQPFRAAILQPGTERILNWRAQLVADLQKWDHSWGELPEGDLRRLQRHADQYGPWCTGVAPVPSAIPGVEAMRAKVRRRVDWDGVRRWVCDLTFRVTPDAVRTWFPAALVKEPVGIDPGLRHPVTWASASASAAHSLQPALVDLTGFPGSQGPGARALRRATWERHEVGYDRAWQDVLRHQTIRLEQTDWATLSSSNAKFFDRAVSNYLITWLGHLAALAPLTGSVIELIPSRHTSVSCSECGYRHEVRQEGKFTCANPDPCCYSALVDVNAACNIAQGMVSRRELAAQRSALAQKT